MLLRELLLPCKVGVAVTSFRKFEKMSLKHLITEVFEFSWRTSCVYLGVDDCVNERENIVNNYFSMILNRKDLATSTARSAVLDIIDAGLISIETKKIIERTVAFRDGRVYAQGEEVYSADGQGRLFVIGVGKSAIEAGVTLEMMLGDTIIGGVVIDVERPKHCLLTRIQCFEGSNPFPSDRNVAASKAIKEILEDLKEEDTVLFLVSSGWSTLLCLPDEHATCMEEHEIIRSLVRVGASLDEISIVRKHSSYLRGGYLAKEAYPARVISIIFSDVPGNDLGSVASGPTVEDKTTVEEATNILKKYNVLKTYGIDYRGLIETPKDKKYFERVTNILAVSNEVALKAMEEKATKLGYKATVCSTCLKGEARDVGVRLVQELHKASSKTVLLYGGEMTVTMKGYGKGGRNQELALSVLPDIGEGEVVASIATDGWDNTPFAGAIVDSSTLKRAEYLRLDVHSYLKNNNSYSFFEKVGDALETGRTRSNVADLVVALRE
jgi:glycerate 2-kinase